MQIWAKLRLLHLKEVRFIQFTEVAYFVAKSQKTKSFKVSCQQCFVKHYEATDHRIPKSGGPRITTK